MEAEHLTTLPVVHDTGRSIASLKQNKLASSILLELVTQLQQVIEDVERRIKP
jgi:hypothetical protein